MTNENLEKNAKEYFEEGVKQLENKKYKSAETFFLKSLKLIPERLSTLSNLFLTLINLGKLEDAEKIVNKTISLYPNEPSLYFNKAHLNQMLNNIDEAIINYRKSISLDNKYYEAYLNLALMLEKNNNLEESITTLKYLIRLNPSYFGAYLNMGILYNKLKMYSKSFFYINKAISIDKNSHEAYNNLSLVLFNMRQFTMALENINTALDINADYGIAYMNRSLIYKEFNKLEKALIDINKAILLIPESAEPYYCQGNIYLELNMLDLALLSFNKALTLNCNYSFLPGLIINTKMRMCEWSDYERNIQTLNLEIQNKKKYSPCFEILSLIDNPKNQYLASKEFLSHQYPLNNSLGKISNNKNKKITIGYYSGDFREHALSYLLAEILELHDRKKFQIIGFSFGLFEDDLMFKRVRKCFDTLIDVNSSSDEQVANISRSLKIDIAVDLMGLTKNSRCGIFSYRVAPIQVNYLGFLGTLASGYHDYIFADKILIDESNQDYFSEKIIYLPSYQVNDTKKPLPKLFNRNDFKIKKDTFIYCCFNNNYKFNPLMFDVWMNILKSVPNSILFLYAENKFVEKNLLLEAEKRFVSSNQLKFGGFLSRADYLGRLKLADLFLDTYPYSAGVTASDSLWVGLPVLTCKGQSFASRMSASLLKAIEIPELITDNHLDYQEIAIELAVNPHKLETIKRKLRYNKNLTRLFDSKKSTINLERAYEKIYVREKSGLEPENLYIFD